MVYSIPDLTLHVNVKVSTENFPQYNLKEVMNGLLRVTAEKKSSFQ